MTMMGFYGKVASRGDFIERNLTKDFQRGWDAWLSAGLQSSQGQLGESWLDAYLTSPLWRFALAPGVCGSEAMAGVLIAPAFFANPTFGTDYFILPAFVIVVLGTMGNFPGALIGGLIIGVAEGLGGLVFGPAMRQLVSLLLFVVVLLLCF